jgi:hypothetical protein
MQDEPEEGDYFPTQDDPCFDKTSALVAILAHQEVHIEVCIQLPRTGQSGPNQSTYRDRNLLNTSSKDEAS